MKKFKLLYTNGSSHTKGGGLEEPKRRDDSCLPLYEKKYSVTWNDRDEINWPARLSNLMNVSLVNEAECGGGLMRIIRMTQDFIHKNWEHRDELLIILEMPGGIRGDFWFEPLSSYMILNSNFNTDDNTIFVSSTREYYPLESSKIREEKSFEEYYKTYLYNFYNHDNELKNSFQNLMSLYSFCKYHNIEIVFQGILNEFRRMPNINIVENEDVFGEQIDEFARRKKMTIGDDVDYPDGHPGYYAHIEYANEMYEFLQKKYNLNDQKRI